MRQAERSASMEMVWARLEAKENAEKEKEKEINSLDMSEKARRDHVYKWYHRCSCFSRDELKEGINNEDPNILEGITSADIELLPWNENGTVANAGIMMKFQLNTK